MVHMRKADIRIRKKYIKIKGIKREMKRMNGTSRTGDERNAESREEVREKISIC
jgi:hypothetical protein